MQAWSVFFVDFSADEGITGKEQYQGKDRI